MINYKIKEVTIMNLQTISNFFDTITTLSPTEARNFDT